jgi:hypothetical protein
MSWELIFNCIPIPGLVQIVQAYHQPWLLFQCNTDSDWRDLKCLENEIKGKSKLVQQNVIGSWNNRPLDQQVRKTYLSEFANLNSLGRQNSMGWSIQLIHSGDIYYIQYGLRSGDHYFYVTDDFQLVIDGQVFAEEMEDRDLITYSWWTHFRYRPHPKFQMQVAFDSEPKIQDVPESKWKTLSHLPDPSWDWEQAVPTIWVHKFKSHFHLHLLDHSPIIS